MGKTPHLCSGYIERINIRRGVLRRTPFFLACLGKIATVFLSRCARVVWCVRIMAREQRKLVKRCGLDRFLSSCFLHPSTSISPSDPNRPILLLPNLLLLLLLGETHRQGIDLGTLLPDKPTGQ